MALYLFLTAPMNETSVCPRFCLCECTGIGLVERRAAPRKGERMFIVVTIARLPGDMNYGLILSGDFVAGRFGRN